VTVGFSGGRSGEEGMGRAVWSGNSSELAQIERPSIQPRPIMSLTPLFFSLCFA
jgi:hypothetical protein